MERRTRQTTKNPHVGFNAWCRYILHVRPGNRTVPFKFSRLFQQFIVDLWASGDQHKLHWLRNQQVIRAELYSGITDWIRAADGDLAELGRKVILPSSYVGGRRFISQCYQDSMAIVRKLGPPTFFITVTANQDFNFLSSYVSQ